MTRFSGIHNNLVERVVVPSINVYEDTSAKNLADIAVFGRVANDVVGQVHVFRVFISFCVDFACDSVPALLWLAIETLHTKDGVVGRPIDSTTVIRCRMRASSNSLLRHLINYLHPNLGMPHRGQVAATDMCICDSSVYGGMSWCLWKSFQWSAAGDVGRFMAVRKMEADHGPVAASHCLVIVQEWLYRIATNWDLIGA